MNKMLLILFLCLSSFIYAENIRPLIISDIQSKAKFNDYWKVPRARGEHVQVVFMSITKETNPNNEIGEETHEFDQVILIVEGKAEVQLNDEVSNAHAGDMIIIPKGAKHNLKNLSPNSALKLISVYGEQDIPDNIYKTKADESAWKID